MKKLSLILTGTLIVLLLMSGCASMMTSMNLNSAKEKAAEHKYTEAINLAASALARSENESTEAAEFIIEIVNNGDAYYNNLVKQYRKPDQENTFAKIYNAYESLVKMYDEVVAKNLQNFTVGGMNYSIKIKDYTTELDSARDVAGEIYYDAAVEKMNGGTLLGYRQAYANLRFVKSMYLNIQSPFDDLDSRINTALAEGTTDIYIVVPSDFKMDYGSGTMGDFLQQNLNKNSDWVEFHYGPKVDMAYQAWEISVAGEQFINAATGKVKNDNAVLEFGKEIDADIVVYAVFDNLNSDKTKVGKFNDKFDGTTSEGEAYVLDLNWSRHSKETSLDYGFYVVDVKSQKTLAGLRSKSFKQEIVLYTGTYTLTPNIWSTLSTKNFAEMLNIKDIKDYHFVNVGYNGWAYRIDYESAGLEERDKAHFDEDMATFERYAQTEAQYISLMIITESISKAIADYM